MLVRNKKAMLFAKMFETNYETRIFLSNKPGLYFKIF